MAFNVLMRDDDGALVLANAVEVFWLSDCHAMQVCVSNGSCYTIPDVGRAECDAYILSALSTGLIDLRERCVDREKG